MSETGDRQFALRMPADLYKEIEAWAREDIRSMNQQIVFILREALAERTREQLRKKLIDGGDKMEGSTQTPGRAAELELAPA